MKLIKTSWNEYAPEEETRDPYYHRYDAETDRQMHLDAVETVQHFLGLGMDYEGNLVPVAL